MSPSRRRFLRTAAALSVPAIAGCTGGDDSGEPTNESDASGEDGGTNTSDTESDGGDGASEFETPEAAARAFVDRLFAGEYEAATDLFSEETRGQAGPGRIERLRLGFETVLGSFDSVSEVETGVRSGYERVDLTLAFADGTGQLEVLTNDDAALAGAVIDGEYEPASYADETAFETSEHVLDREGCELGATLATPTGVDTAPGVVIVHGSGAVDRDGTIGANKPYRDLAEGLASRGVAVLRYEKRTFACNVPPAEHTVDRVTVDDAVAALAWLRDRDEVASDDVTVVGHSLGAMMAPEIADRDGEVAGVVGLAAPARPLQEVFLDQIDHLASVGEHTIDAVAQQRDRWEGVAEQIESGNYEPDERLLTLPGAFWSSVEGYDPVATAGDLDVRQAYLQGGRDYQVTREDDFSEWRTAFGDDPAVTLSEYPSLDHPFLPGEGPSVPQSYAVPNEVGEAVVADLAAWLTE